MKYLSELRQASRSILDAIPATQADTNTHAEVCATHTTELRVVYEANDFSVSTSKSNVHLGVRALINGRQGFATTNSISHKALHHVAQEAQTLARLSVESPYPSIAPSSTVSGNHSELGDATLMHLPPKELYRLAEFLIDEARSDPRITLDRAETTWTLSTQMIQNSNGLEQAASSASLSWFVMGMAKTADEVTQFDYDGSVVTHLGQAEAEIRRSAHHFRDSALGSLQPRPGKNYSGKILLSPEAALDLVQSVVGFNSNARAQQDGMSVWKDSLGKKVASNLITIFEDPLDRTRPGGWSPFDREGVLSQKHLIVNRGNLEFTAHNCFTAKRAGVAPTGNAAGGALSMPSIGYSNFTIECADPAQALSEQALHQALGTGVYVKRFSGNQDPISGAYSGVAKNSYWVENGIRTHALQDIMIAGNLFELLKNIVAVGSVSHTIFGSSRSPMVLVDGVSVTAAG